MSASKLERMGGTLELPPKLRLRRVTAQTIGEAVDKTRKNGAGEDELQEMLAWLNKNCTSDMARRWKSTWNFFPNAGDDDPVSFTRWLGGKFWRDSFRRGGKWDGYDCVVEKY
ncbi:MAG: hypothetical protein V4449_00265 [Patescibacteria group bacterium]